MGGGAIIMALRSAASVIRRGFPTQLSIIYGNQARRPVFTDLLVGVTAFFNLSFFHYFKLLLKI